VAVSRFHQGATLGQSLLWFSSRSRKRKGNSSLPEPRQTVEVAAARNFWTSKSCLLSRQTGFFYTLQAEPPFVFFLIEEEKSPQPERLD